MFSVSVWGLSVRSSVVYLLLGMTWCGKNNGFLIRFYRHQCNRHSIRIFVTYGNTEAETFITFPEFFSVFCFILSNTASSLCIPPIIYGNSKLTWDSRWNQNISKSAESFVPLLYRINFASQLLSAFCYCNKWMFYEVVSASLRFYVDELEFFILKLRFHLLIFN